MQLVLLQMLLTARPFAKILSHRPISRMLLLQVLLPTHMSYVGAFGQEMIGASFCTISDGRGVGSGLLLLAVSKQDGSIVAGRVASREPGNKLIRQVKC